MNSTDLIQHVWNMPMEAAHLVMAESEMVWLFGPRMSGWSKPHVVVATEHFGLPLTPEVFLTASRHEQGLLEALVAHLESQASHCFVVLYREGSTQEGWVCLVPTAGLAQVKQLVSWHQLELSPAALTEVLQ
ncbi:hypothetical protein [Deinococcus roseus]|uniref:Uncharacterized protein n=1 Tax=Deinococcus roseus TaxID=392414 RepID=A0ABQ2CZJ0_9DEIO|nr:hypothetical protein [Deinococcus roseus]GGJ36129.1 hypothetical protein GCM10008938_22790 [Deinococcus roseus]